MMYFQNLPGELNRSLSGSLNSPGELETLHDDQEAGVDVRTEIFSEIKYFPFPDRLRCPGPVVVSAPAPDRAVTSSPPQLHSGLENFMLLRQHF